MGFSSHNILINLVYFSIKKRLEKIPDNLLIN